MRTRTWRWLRVRVAGLLACESRLQRAIAPPPEMPSIPWPRRR